MLRRASKRTATRLSSAEAELAPSKRLASSAKRPPASVAAAPEASSAKRPPASVSAAPEEALAWFEIFAGANNEEYRAYMREEWGFEKRGDRPLFEKLCLEGAQAGLSWATILKKREAYRKAFHNFDIERCAAMSAAELRRLLEDTSLSGADAIVRNRAKVESVVSNAKAVLALRREGYGGSAAATHGSFDAFLWDFVGGQPRLHTRRADEPCPSKDATSEAMSAALKARGFRFVGPTICYSLMQSCGLIVDHPAGTPEWETAKRRLAARPR